MGLGECSGVCWRCEIEDVWRPVFWPFCGVCVLGWHVVLFARKLQAVLWLLLFDGAFFLKAHWTFCRPAS